MKRTRANVFLNQYWFLAFTIIMLLAGIVELFMCFIDKSTTYILVPFVAVLGVIMYGSYRAHDKNVMKGLMGAVLMWLLCQEVTFVCTVLGSSKELFQTAMEGGFSFYVIVEMLAMLTVLFIFGLHFMINSQRESSPTEIWINQLLNVVLIIFYMFLTIIRLIYDFLPVSEVVLMIFKVSLVLMVISIESRLDEYRIRRERRGWVNPDAEREI